MKAMIGVLFSKQLGVCSKRPGRRCSNVYGVSVGISHLDKFLRIGWLAWRTLSFKSHDAVRDGGNFHTTQHHSLSSSLVLFLSRQQASSYFQTSLTNTIQREPLVLSLLSFILYFCFLITTTTPRYATFWKRRWCTRHDRGPRCFRCTRCGPPLISFGPGFAPENPRDAEWKGILPAFKANHAVS